MKEGLITKEKLPLVHITRKQLIGFENIFISEHIMSFEKIHSF
jgi:hypothetical protein